MSRRIALSTAGNLLLQLRLYNEAGDLLNARAQGAGDEANQLAHAELIRAVRRLETIGYPDDDPCSVVKKLMVLIAVNENNVHFRSFFLHKSAVRVR